MIQNTETTKTIREKVAKVLEVDPKHILLAEYELKELPALQDPKTMQTLLAALQYGKDMGKLDDVCSSLGTPTHDGKATIVFDLGPALKLLMHNLQIDPKGGAK